jgi:hypothetical protein
VPGDDAMPRTVVYLCPGFRCDVVPFTFYRDAPPGYLLDVRHIPVSDYSPAHGRTLLAGLEGHLPSDLGDVECVVLGGSAFSLAFEWPELCQELAATTARVGVRVVTDMVPVVGRLRRPGTDGIVAAHRLAGVSDDALTGFLRSAGLECHAVVSDPASVAANSAGGFAAAAEQARELTALALERCPTANTVLLLGGSWWVEPARRFAEARERHLVNNLTAIVDLLPLLSEGR